MKRKYKILLIVIAVLIVVGFSAKRVLLDSSSVAEVPGIAERVEDFRKAAGSGDTLPVKINIVRVAEGTFPGGMVVAGDRSKTYTAPLVAFQVVYERELPGGGNTVIIDAGLDRAGLDTMGGQSVFNEAAYNMVQRAMRKAAAILITHEHFDHAGGIARSQFFNEISPRVLLTPEQAAGPEIKNAGFTPEMIAKCGKLSYNGLHSPFPGMVLLKTPGHLQGHQVVYVKLRNGNEFLIAGDIAWNMDNVTRLISRPLLVSLFLGEDRAAVAGQLRWLHDRWYKAHPEVRIIVSHDRAQQDGYVKSGLLGGDFEL
ncbi:MAG TPA: MBL fold metallo-hydrolase, partial [Spirochaetota bacterium]|nr:MBL fold metallo-hydrolase [Spirochaetota bacterium]